MKKILLTTLIIVIGIVGFAAVAMATSTGESLTLSKVENPVPGLETYRLESSAPYSQSTKIFIVDLLTNKIVSSTIKSGSDWQKVGNGNYITFSTTTTNTVINQIAVPVDGVFVWLNTAFSIRFEWGNYLIGEEHGWSRNIAVPTPTPTLARPTEVFPTKTPVQTPGAAPTATATPQPKQIFLPLVSRN